MYDDNPIHRAADEPRPDDGRAGPNRRRRLLVPVLASALAAAVALPASVALAGGGDGGGARTDGTGSTFEQVQQERSPDRERPDGRDCPHEEQGDGGSSSSSSPEV
jgi:hypothetical protein